MSTWLSIDHWDACTGEIPWQEMVKAMEGRVRAVGIYADHDAFTQITLYPPEAGDALWHVACHQFPKSDAAGLERCLLETAKDGWLTGVAFDRWDCGVGRIAGKANVPEIPMGAGFQSLSAPFSVLDELIANRLLHHGSHPELRQMAAATAVCVSPDGNRKPEGRGISGIIALTMALFASGRTLQVEG